MVNCFSASNASVGLYADEKCVTVYSKQDRNFLLVKSQSSVSKFFENLLCEIQCKSLKKQSCNIWIHNNESGLGEIFRITNR